MVNKNLFKPLKHPFKASNYDKSCTILLYILHELDNKIRYKLYDKVNILLKSHMA